MESLTCRMKCSCGRNAFQRLGGVCEVCFEVKHGTAELFQKVCRESPERGLKRQRVCLSTSADQPPPPPPKRRRRADSSSSDEYYTITQITVVADVHREGGEYFPLPEELERTGTGAVPHVPEIEGGPCNLSNDVPMDVDAGRQVPIQEVPANQLDPTVDIAAAVIVPHPQEVPELLVLPDPQDALGPIRRVRQRDSRGRFVKLDNQNAAPVKRVRKRDSLGRFAQEDAAPRPRKESTKKRKTELQKCSWFDYSCLLSRTRSGAH